MKEILLQHEELLYLLDMMGAHALVSIAKPYLFPANPGERKAALERGEDSLIRRNLLQPGSARVPELDTSLRAIITTIALPEIAILVMQNNKGEGLRFYWFYQSESTIIEHTVTSEKLHHLTVQSDVPALFQRIEDILRIWDRQASHAYVTMDQTIFFKVKELVEHHAHEQARDILKQQGFSDPITHSFLHVLEQPVSVSNIAFLRCVEETVIDARNIALLQDEQAVWSARQTIPGQTDLVVETTNAPEIKEYLLSCFKELASEPDLLPTSTVKHSFNK